MNELQIGLLIVVVTTMVLFSGFPIAWGLTLVSVVFLVAFKGPSSLQILATQFMDELNSFALLTIPLFVLLGASIGVSAASTMRCSRARVRMPPTACAWRPRATAPRCCA